jgi:hypothetical protein
MPSRGVPSGQDWEPVVIRKHPTKSAETKDEKAVNAARRTGGQVDTVKKFDAGRLPKWRLCLLHAGGMSYEHALLVCFSEPDHLFPDLVKDLGLLLLTMTLEGALGVMEKDLPSIFLRLRKGS